MPNETSIGAHLQEWASAEPLPQNYWTPMHPLVAIVVVAERSGREYLAHCTPNQKLRWIVSKQEINEVSLSVVTVSRFEAAGFTPASLDGLQLWLQTRVEDLLKGEPNIKVEIVCGS